MNVFVAYARFPETDRNAGALRVFEVIRILARDGHFVTFLAPSANEPKYRSALEELGVECLCDEDRAVVGDVESFGRLLRERNFSVAVFAEYFIYNRYAPYFRMLLPECRLVLDALDLEHVRCEREARLLNTREAIENAARTKREEIAALRDADAVWTVTEVEKQAVLKIAPGKPVCVIPTIHQVDSEVPGFDARSGIVFLGNYHHRPNVDAIHYFMEDIFPTIRRRLPDAEFLIAGAYPDQGLYRYQEEWENVRVTGFVDDHRALLRQCRVGIAPLRYGAGMKGKIGEYMGCGLPCVTTSTGAEGMGLTNGQDALIADSPADFAECVVKLYSDADLWTLLSRNGIEHVRALSTEAVAPMVAEAISVSAGAALSAKPSGAANIMHVLKHPGELHRWLLTAGRTLRRAGLSGLLRQFRVWMHRPPPGA